MYESLGEKLKITLISLFFRKVLIPKISDQIFVLIIIEILNVYSKIKNQQLFDNLERVCINVSNWQSISFVNYIGVSTFFFFYIWEECQLVSKHTFNLYKHRNNSIEKVLITHSFKHFLHDRLKYM